MGDKALDLADAEQDASWTSEDTRDFIEFGDFFVPDRELHQEIFSELLTAVALSQRVSKSNLKVLEIGCGEGRLCHALLSAHEGIDVTALDGSEEMIAAARQRLEGFSERVNFLTGDLAEASWRGLYGYSFCYSSLAIHHLDDGQKRQLFKNVAAMLTPGGCFAIMDLIKPMHDVGWSVAAREWDRAVLERTKVKGSDMRPYEYFNKTDWNYYSDPEPDPVDKPSGLFDQLSWMREAGLTCVDVYWMSGGHALFAGFMPDLSRSPET